MVNHEEQSNDGSAGVWMTLWHELDRDHGARAVLSRCTTVDDVYFLAPYQRLRRSLQGRPEGLEKWYGSSLEVAVCLTATIRNPTGRQLAELMAERGVSEMRFQRLLRIDAEQPNELLRQMRRALHYVDRMADLSQLVKDIQSWGSPTKRAKRRWAEQYYNIFNSNNS